MEAFDRKAHWENLYATKQLEEVSWYQPVPETSLQFVAAAGLSKDARIIDVGGGDSLFADHLLEAGYTDITVVDISANALERAKNRLGEKAERIKWIVADVTELALEEQYDFWHDRAVFHFLTHVRDIANYSRVIRDSIRKNGQLVIGTFSENGPLKCSGIDIKQYSESSMTEHFRADFEKMQCVETLHHTPFNTTQHFVFCSFQKR